MSVNLTPEIICKAVSWGTHSSIISVDPEGSIRPNEKKKLVKMAGQEKWCANICIFFSN